MSLNTYGTLNAQTNAVFNILIGRVKVGEGNYIRDGIQEIRC